jgi:RimJ/RimL family protein N-acetyltransferase
MQTERLFLRPFTPDDAEAYWPLVSLPEVLRYTGEQAQASLDDVRRTLLSRPIRDYSVHGFGRMACIEKCSGRLVGFSGLKYLEDLQEVDVGYRFLPDCWGKGYATESAKVLMQQGILEHGITRIIGLVQPENLASVRVLSKLGLTFERKIRPSGSASELELYATTGTGA